MAENYTDIKYLVWYFGSKYLLGHALGVPQGAVSIWGDVLPEKYHKRMREIMEEDGKNAQESA